MKELDYNGMPHVCGDEPFGHWAGDASEEYAPRMWG